MDVKVQSYWINQFKVQGAQYTSTAAQTLQFLQDLFTSSTQGIDRPLQVMAKTQNNNKQDKENCKKAMA